MYPHSKYILRKRKMNRKYFSCLDQPPFNSVNVCLDKIIKFISNPHFINTTKEDKR